MSTCCLTWFFIVVCTRNIHSALPVFGLITYTYTTQPKKNFMLIIYTYTYFVVYESKTSEWFVCESYGFRWTKTGPTGWRIVIIIYRSNCIVTIIVAPIKRKTLFWVYNRRAFFTQTVVDIFIIMPELFLIIIIIIIISVAKVFSLIICAVRRSKNRLHRVRCQSCVFSDVEDGRKKPSDFRTLNYRPFGRSSVTKGFQRLRR